MVSSRISPIESEGGMVQGGSRADSDVNTAATNKRKTGGMATREGSRQPVHSDNKNDSKNQFEEGGNTVTSTAHDTSGTKSRKHHHRRRRHRHGSKDTGGTNYNNGDTWDADGGGQEDKFKLLVEFIPYVGLGDATRDNMVRCFRTASVAFEIRGPRRGHDLAAKANAFKRGDNANAVDDS